MTGETNIAERSCRIFQEYLSRRGMRASAERLMLLEFACAQNAPFSARGLHQAMEDANLHVAPATVYNTVKLLCDCGLVHVVASDSTEHLFAVRARSTMSYVCRRCGKSKPIRDSKAETFLMEHHFRGISTECFTLTVAGLCPACAKALKTMASNEQKSKVKQIHKENKK